MGLLHGDTAPEVPQPLFPDGSALPRPAHLAHEDQRLPELSLADGTDITSFCALLPSGPDAVVLLEGGEREKPSCGPSPERCPQKHGESRFRLLVLLISVGAI